MTNVFAVGPYPCRVSQHPSKSRLPPGQAFCVARQRQRQHQAHFPFLRLQSTLHDRCPSQTTAIMTSTIGIPIKLLNEAQGHIVTLELDSGTTYRGKLIEGMRAFPRDFSPFAVQEDADCRCSLNILAEDNMNVQLKDITVTARDGRVSHLEQVYIRGSHVRFFIVPDMLRYALSRKPAALLSDILHGARTNHLFFTPNRNAPMFKSRNARGRGVGLARGRATVSRALAGGRGGGGGRGGRG